MADATQALTHYHQQPQARRNTTLPENATDAVAIHLWLRSHRSLRTREAYRADINDLRAFIQDKPLQALSLLDLMDFEAYLTQERLQPSSIARKLSAIKSLLTFARKQATPLSTLALRSNCQRLKRAWLNAS